MTKEDNTPYLPVETVTKLGNMVKLVKRLAPPDPVIPVQSASYYSIDGYTVRHTPKGDQRETVEFHRIGETENSTIALTYHTPDANPSTWELLRLEVTTARPTTGSIRYLQVTQAGELSVNPYVKNGVMSPQDAEPLLAQLHNTLEPFLS